MTAPKPRRWPVVVGVVVVICAVVAVAAGVPRGIDQVEHSSAYCAKCHEEHAVEDTLGGHSDVACQDCHQLPEGERISMLWAGLGTPSPIVDHGELDVASCERCHSSEPEEWVVLMRTQGHSSHSGEPALAPCHRCHGGSLHGDPEPEEGCLSCHADVPLLAEPRAESECVVCHSFGGSRSAREGSAPLWGEEITAHNVHGAAECSRCHNPHRLPRGDKGGQELQCTDCHQGRVVQSALAGPAEHRRCEGCHGVHAEREAVTARCTSCHSPPEDGAEDEPARGEPTPDGTWAALGMPVGKEGTPDEEAANLTHEGRCPTCHLPHDWVAEPTGCGGCHDHEDEVALLAALPEDTHEDCVACHEPHSPMPTAGDCAVCHRNPARRAASSSGAEHRNCLSCHEPHAGKPRVAVVCASCHRRERAQLRTGVPEHRNCARCHQSHGSAIRGSACNSCHQPEASRLRGPAEHRACQSCHAGHAFDAAAAITQCSACHTFAVAANAVHRRDPCMSCHAVHGNGQDRAGRCRACHEEIRPAVARHDRCQSCHPPHARAAQCGGCHTQQHATARTWLAGGAHAGRCSECHGAHAAGTVPPCGSCHRAEATVAHRGSAHRGCQGCHPPHGRRPTGRDGWWARCGSCHRNEARQATSGGNTHRRCDNCHDNPQRAAATCVSCHQGAAGTLQHRQHTMPCTDCHPAHGDRPLNRNHCLRCHDDQTRHELEVPDCQSCHPFG